MKTVISNGNPVLSSNNQWDIESRILEEVLNGKTVSITEGIEKSINEKYYGIVCGKFADKFVQFQESDSKTESMVIRNVVIWDLKDFKFLSNPVKSQVALGHFNKKVLGLSMRFQDEVFVLRNCLKFHEFVEEK